MAKKKSDDKANQPTDNEPAETNYDEEPDFSDPDGYVDDIEDEGKPTRRYIFDREGGSFRDFGPKITRKINNIIPNDSSNLSPCFKIPNPST